MNKLRRIIHLADLHVRLYRRHDEYKKSFRTFYDQIQQENVDDTLIVVCGDVVHSKIDLSPEMVELTSDFLSTCATIAPTVVITGNHDVNLSNANRLDALSPIIKNINSPTLEYWKHSGIYSVSPDVDFYVHSLLGDRAQWPVPLDDQKTKIALFHGPVHNAVTDVGYTITNRHVTIETFDGFDMVLMGDIHRHQVLQTDPPIVYASSLIQQNHGETRRGHGWCDWNVKDRTFKFMELPNSHGFYTLEVKDGIIPDWSDMPENVYLRLYGGSLTQTQIKELVTEIRQVRNIEELSVTKFSGAKQQATQLAPGFLDIFDVQVQNKLIAEYLLEVSPSTSNETIERVLDLNKLKNEDISTEDLPQKILWKPLTLKYDNLFTYGESNSIDFTNQHGVIGIFAPNASGKTSIAEAICFALYDRTPRTQKAVNIMNSRTNSCFCEFRFMINAIEYVITRKGTKNKKGEVKIDVDFYKIENGNTVSLNGEERRYTNQNIKRCVGDFEDFLLTTFSSSSQQGLFVDRGQSDRKDLLSQFMGLNIFDRLHTIAAEESKEIAGALKQFKNDDFTAELALTRETLKTEKSSLEKTELNYEYVDQKLQEARSDVINCRNQIVEIVKDININDLTARHNTADQLIEKHEKEIETIKLSQFELEGNLNTAKIVIQQQVYLEDDIKKFRDQQTEWNREKQQLEKYIIESKTISTELFNLQLFQYDPSCSFCVKNGHETIHFQKTLTLALETVKKNASETEIRFNELQQKLTDWYDVGFEYQNYCRKKDWFDKYSLIFSQESTRYEKVKNELEKARVLKNKILEDIEELKKNKEILAQNRIHRDKLFVLDRAVKALELDFSDLSKSVKVLTSKVAVLETKESNILERIKTAVELEAKYDAYDSYLLAVSRDGLPYKLMADILPNLEIAVNDLLNQMVQFSLLFETDGKNINIKLRYSDEKVWPLELASGMEKFVSSLAIRVALSDISALPKSTFLIIDEGLGALDQDNLTSMHLLFDILRTKFEFILLISHVDAARDIADTLAEIERTPDGFSRIKIV